MMRASRGFLGVALAVVVTIGIAAASRAPFVARGDPSGVLRLAWSARPERVEHCRRLSPEELAERPAHMRQVEECEGRSARYRLLVETDGEVVADEVLTGAGARADRPIYVLREVPLAPGPHTFRVRFVRLDSIADGAAATSRSDHQRVPPVLELEARAEVGSRAVLLVTYDPDLARLVSVSRQATTP